ncbi:hypothetical protein EE612_005202 [Oryza sativa]|nr:hypothetical protein EE612_005202 [Oryza sativa]
MSSSLQCPDDPAPSMNVEAVLHMKEGVGETSYAKNSTLQVSTPHRLKSMDTVKSLVTESARDVYASLKPERFTLADLGCSSGTNALGMVEEIVRSVAEVCRGSSPPPEFSVLLNDLPTNDFNTIFSRLPEFTGKLKADADADAGDDPMVFLSGVPGSFYGRLFPSKNVHFVCSFSSLHWLSQVRCARHERAREQGEDVHIEHEPSSRGSGVLEAVPERLQPVPQVTRRRGRRRRPDGGLHARQGGRAPRGQEHDPAVGSPLRVVRRAGVTGGGGAGQGGRVRRAVLRAVDRGDRGGGAAAGVVQDGGRAGVRGEPEWQRRREEGRKDGVDGSEGHPGVHAGAPLRDGDRRRALRQVHRARHGDHGEGGGQERPDWSGPHEAVTCQLGDSGSPMCMC